MGNQPQTKFEIFIDHEQLKQKKCAKYLGLFIDKNHGKKGISKLLILNQRNSHNMQNTIYLPEKQLRDMYQPLSSLA